MLDFELRGYQREALDSIYSALQAEQNVLLQAIMGAGKTALSVILIQRLVNENPDMKFLLLMHKKELVQQFQRAFRKFTNISDMQIGICCAGLSNKKEISKKITLATIQSFISVVNDYNGAGLIVIDEVHRCDINSKTQYKQVLDRLRAVKHNSRLLGLTATPGRLGHGYIYGTQCRKGKINLFAQRHHTIKYKRLCDEGYLVPLHGKIANHDQLNADLAGVTIQGDYVLNQLGEIMAKDIHVDTAVEAIKGFCGRYNCVCVFCCTIDHAERVYQGLGGIEGGVTIVHSRLTDMEREANMMAWKSGAKRIIVSVNILIEGFDLPRLDCLVMARPTMSSSLFLQAVGRVLRPHESKDHGMMIDLTDNTARFGLDLDNIKIYVPKEIEVMQKKENELNKLCPMCEKECHVVCRACPHCGYEWPANEVTEAAEVPGLTDVVFGEAEPVEPEVVDVVDMVCYIHESRKSGKSLGRIDLMFGPNIFKPDSATLWLCLPDFYDGYAVQMAEKKWAMLTSQPLPQSIEDFVEAARTIARPSKMTIVTGEYPEVQSVEFDELPF